MKTYKNFTEYINQAPAEHKAKLNETRKIIKAAVPTAVESISYGMPAYTWKGAPLFYFAAMKGHLGLYATPGPIKTLAKDLAGYSTSKSCVRVPWSAAVPKSLIIKLLKERMKEIRLKG